MRLTTLARKIDKTPNQLIAFLEEKNIDILKGLHGKLESETVELVINHFLPEQNIEEFLSPENDIEIQEIEETPSLDLGENEGKQVIDEFELVSENIEEEKKEEPVQVEEPTVEMAVPVEEEIKAEPKSGTVDDLENDNIDEIEHIKVKKVTLEGIKVVGKIDLPEKPKKEPVESEEGKGEGKKTEAVEKPRRNLKSGNRNFDRNKKKNTQGRNRNPLSYEEKLKNEEREKLRERRKKEKEEKRRKKIYYQKNLQPKNTPGPKKKNKKEVGAQSKAKVIVHKNPIRRLWAWLNGEYDQY